MKEQNYFSNSFQIFFNNFKKLSPYFIALIATNFFNDYLYLKLNFHPLIILVSTIFFIIILITTILLIKTIIQLLKNEKTSLSENLKFLNKNKKNFLKTLWLWVIKFLKISGIPLLIFIISIFTFFYCSSFSIKIFMPAELIENSFNANFRENITGSCTVAFYLSTLIAPLSFIIFAIFAIIANIKLFFTWYSFVDAETKITENHVKISNELTKGKKGELIIFIILAAFGFAILTFIIIKLLQFILPSTSLDLLANSIGMGLFTTLYSAFFAQYYLTLKEAPKK